MAEDQQVGQQTEQAMPPPAKVDTYRPMFMSEPEQIESGEWALRFLLNPMEHVVVLIPDVVAVALREKLPSVAIDRSASKIVVPS